MKTLKKNRFLLVSILTVFAAVSAILGLSSFGKKTALAEETASETFVMEDGVSAKLSNGGGIRFRVKMDETTGLSVKNGESALQIVVAPYYYFDKGVDYAIENGRKIDVEKTKVYQEGGAYYANGCITDIKEANRKLNLQAVAVIKSGETVTKQTAVNVNAKGNMYDVLTSAVLDASGSYEKTIFKIAAYSAWFGTESYPITVLNDTEYNTLKTKLAGEGSFNGKYYEVKSGVTAYNAGDFTAVGGNVSKWDGVTLNLNGGKLSGELTEYKRGAGATLPEITKEGFTFGGWYDNAEFTGDAVTQISASDEGDKTFYARWIENVSLTLADKAQVSLYGNNDFTVDFGAINESIEGDIESVTVDGVEFASKTFADGKLTLDTQTLGSITGDRTLIAKFVKTNASGAITKITTVNVPVLVVTKVLKTADDVLNWNTLAYAADSSKEYWGGYFVLGNDIDMTGKNYQGSFSYADLCYTEGPNAWKTKEEFGGLEWLKGYTGGFRGTFDGRGFAIKNMTVEKWNTSFVGQMAAGGVIKNVSFTGVTLKAATTLISVGGIGTIENIYAEIVAYDNGTANDKTGVLFSRDTMAAARVNKCFVEFKCNTAVADGFSALGRYHLGYGQLNGVYAVGAGMSKDSAIRILTSDQDNGSDVYDGYETIEAFKTAGVANWENDFWTMVDGVPMPKRIVESAGASITNAVTILPSSQRTLTIESDHQYLVYTLDEAAIAAGLTISGNVVTIPESATVSSFTVTATSMLNSAVKAEKTFYIVSSEVINVADRKEVDMQATEDVIIDLTSYNVSGNLTSAKLGGTAIDLAGVAFENGTLTIARSALGNVYGEKALELTFEAKSGEVVTKITTGNADMLFVTKYVLTAADLTNLLNYTVSEGGYLKGGYFVQSANITLTSGRAGFGDWSNEAGAWVNQFTGVYDGQGYIIDGMTQGTNAGLFGYMNGGTVKNVVFIKAVLNGNGGFVVTELHGGVIENVAVYGSMGSGATGQSWSPNSMLVGKGIGGTIKNCYVELTSHPFSGTGNAGMLVGTLSGATVKDCIAVNLKSGENASIQAIGPSLTGNTDTATVKTFASLDAAKEYGLTADFSTWSTDFWTVTGGRVHPKNLSIEDIEDPYGLRNKTELTIEFTQGYYLSTAPDGMHGNVVSTADNSNQFFCTQKFTRETLPVGSVIYVASDWQYRPEGWINGAANTTRPDNYKGMYIKVTDAWWGSFTERAFNISKVGGGDISSQSAIIPTIFKIYVPKA